MSRKVDHPDRLIARIADRQHGVASMRQFRAAGVSEDAVLTRARTGHLHRIHRGVYGVGHGILPREGLCMAAVLACGEGAVLSHGSAAVLWGVLKKWDGPVEVSTPARSGRSKRRGIRLHRSTSLLPRTTTRRHGIPVTTPARTIADLRGTTPEWLWRRAVRQAEFAGYRLELETDGTRSDLERDFLRICRRAGLPAPEVNVRIARWTVDFLWREERLIVETDSYRYHRGRIAFQDDHARELDLRRAGFKVRRFDERQINEEPECVAADLVAALVAS